ncbi:MAG: hypothetical protein LIO45_01045 [Clostridiales bacterium]|nr:hypothetical protein [Clostridiales bacterium]
MKKIVKVIGAAGAVALAASLIPYHFKSDKESGEMELGGLLWNLKKTPGEEEDTYTMELLPFIGKEKEEAPAEEAADEDAPTEEAAAEEAPAEEADDDAAAEETAAPEVAEEAQVEVDVTVEVADEAAAEDAQ